MFHQMEIMPQTVVLQDVVEGSEGHPGSMVAPCPDDVILGGIEFHGNAAVLMVNFQNVVENFKGCLVRTHIVQGKNSTHIPSLLLKVL